jgi:hypothetical protein
MALNQLKTACNAFVFSGNLPSSQMGGSQAPMVKNVFLSCHAAETLILRAPRNISFVFLYARKQNPRQIFVNFRTKPPNLTQSNVQTVKPQTPIPVEICQSVRSKSGLGCSGRGMF